MTLTPLTPAEQQASQRIQAVSDSLPKENTPARNLCTGLQGLIARASIAKAAQAQAEEGRALAERQVELFKSQLEKVETYFEAEADLRVEKVESKAASRIDTIEARVELEVKEVVENAEKATAKIRTELDQLAEKVSELNVAIQPLQEENWGLRVQLVQARAALNAKNDTEERCQSVEKRQCAYETRIDKLKKEIEDSQEKLHTTEEQLENEKINFNQELEKSTQEKEALQKKLRVLKNELQETKQQLEAFENALPALEKLNTQAQAKVQQSQTFVDQSSNSIQELAEENKRLKAELLAEHEARETAETTLLAQNEKHRADIAQAVEEERQRIFDQLSIFLSQHSENSSNSASPLIASELLANLLKTQWGQ